MNINSELRFMDAPTVEMPRSNVDLSFEHQTTFNVGELIPIGVIPVYPGDTHKVTISKVIRLQTLLNPIYGTFYCDVGAFFVPNRLVYEHWEELMGENKTSAWIPQATYTTPNITTGKDSNNADVPVPVGSLADYMGIPVGYVGTFNALPIRAYHKLYDDWWRDENLQDPENIYVGESTQALTTATADYYKETYMWPRKACRMHDFLSSATPAPQKGPAVSIPLGTVAPVYSTDKFTPYYSDPTLTDLTVSGMVGLAAAGTSGTTTKEVGFRAKSALPANGALSDASVFGHSPGTTSTYDFTPVNLWAELGEATAANINDLRMAFQIQRLLERDAYSGSRYIEVLKSHFGVTSPDARLQRSEYLGGNRVPLNIHQVVNNSQDGSHALGNLGAMSHTVDINESFTKSFVEHGFIIITACVRYQNVYAQSMEKFWSYSDRYSYYWPVLAHIGNQPVLNREIYALPDANKDPDGVFGYQEAWYDLRTRQNRCSSEMRPGVSGSLATWNLSDYYTATPTLSDEWIQFDSDITDRVLAVPHYAAKQIFADFWIQDDATRVIPLYSIPGLIDHF